MCHLSPKSGLLCWAELYNYEERKHFLEEKSQTWNWQKNAQGAHLKLCFSTASTIPLEIIFLFLCQPAFHQSKVKKGKEGFLRKMLKFLWPALTVLGMVAASKCWRKKNPKSMVETTKPSLLRIVVVCDAFPKMKCRLHQFKGLRYKIITKHTLKSQN